MRLRSGADGRITQGRTTLDGGRCIPCEEGDERIIERGDVVGDGVLAMARVERLVRDGVQPPRQDGRAGVRQHGDHPREVGRHGERDDVPFHRGVGGLLHRRLR